jgi:uncharacterized tellurite resistance protein B-like protein
MYQTPSTSQLVTAVKSFIDDIAAPELKGHAAFHARVASNVLATVLRELEIGQTADSEERKRLSELLNTNVDTDAETLNRALSQAIRSGEITLATVGLLDHLKSTTIDQLSIDQPRYSGLGPHRT